MHGAAQHMWLPVHPAPDKWGHQKPVGGPEQGQAMLPEEVGPTLHTVTGQWCTMISFFHSWEPLRGKDQTQNCQDSGRGLTCSAGCAPKRPLSLGYLLFRHTQASEPLLWAKKLSSHGGFPVWGP